MSQSEIDVLALVLELRPDQTRKHTPALIQLSFYSSELKGLKQIAGLLASVRSGKGLSDNPISRARYFNTLSNQGLVSGSAIAPVLTKAADVYLNVYDQSPNDLVWRDNGIEIEYLIIKGLVESLKNGDYVSDLFLQIWFNAQQFFDCIPNGKIDSILLDREKLLFFYHINSVGWEIARYFRLSESEQSAFEAAFEKVLPSNEWTPVSPTERAAAQYKDAALTIQADVRYRIAGFLGAFRRLQLEMGAELPRLDRQKILRLGVSSEPETGLAVVPKVQGIPLSQPHQLIVTGCPGSGKSHFLGGIIEKSQAKVFRTQFHPESSFFDFVGAFKPQPVYEVKSDTSPLVEATGSPSLYGRPFIDYRYVGGPLIQALVFAYQNPDENVVVLIEEINRGNAAAILGDFLQLLDRDASGMSRYGVMPSEELRAYLSVNSVPSDLIRLPSNLYIWATMNSADQGVFPLDTAFRRRWSFIYKGYGEPCLYDPNDALIDYGGITYSWDSFRGALNSQLVDLGIHEDKLIGPYFLTVSQLSDPKSVLEKLFLYLWDDVLRFRQHDLFDARSFSQVSDEWANSNGAPLRLVLDATHFSQNSEPFADAEDLEEVLTPDVTTINQQ